MSDTKATATLTDVKNKTGDVFALADKHGSVVITSYNKPKYIISTYKQSAEAEPVIVPKVEAQPVKPVPPVELPRLTPPAPIPVVAPPAPIEPAMMEIKLAKTDSGLHNPFSSILNRVKPTPAEPTPAPVTTPPAKPEARWGDVDTRDLWDRRSKRELNWVKQVRAVTV